MAELNLLEAFFDCKIDIVIQFLSFLSIYDVISSIILQLTHIYMNTIKLSYLFNTVF